MGWSTDVTLPKEAEPVWPERCVGCGAGRTSRQLELKTRAIGWRSLLAMVGLPGAAGRRFLAEVPCCPTCHGEARTSGWLRTLALVIGAVVAVGLVRGLGPDLSHLGRLGERAAQMGLVIGAMLLLFAWHVWKPPMVDVTAGSDWVDYEFRDTDYARDFARLNGGRIDGRPVDDDGEPCGEPSPS